MGALLDGIPKARNKQGSSQGTSLPSLPEGITKKESHLAQEVFRRPEIANETIDEAIERKEIPTGTEY